MSLQAAVARRVFADSPGRKGSLSTASRFTQRVLRSPAGVPLGASARAYNLTISHSHRFVWYRVAKVGSRSLLARLGESEATLAVEESRRVHDSALILHGYYRFGFVRDPAERFESCWRDKVVRRNQFGFPAMHHAEMAADIGAFVSFVESLDLENCDGHLRRQSALIDTDRVDFLGRMETFDDDVGELLDRLELPRSGKLPRKNTSACLRDGAGLSPDIRRRIEDLYRIDYETFGYEPSR